MDSRPVRRAVIAWSLSLAVAVSGCRQGAEESLPEGYAYAPMQWPVAWRQEGNALVLLHLERGVDSSGGLTLCNRSAIYRSGEESGAELLFPMPPAMCQLDLRPETTGGVTGSTSLVVANRDSLVTIDVADGRVSAVTLPGVSLRQYGALSPDARVIAFAAIPRAGDTGDGGGDCLYVADARGSDVRRVTCFEGQRVRSTPSWSPDMTRVALSLSEETGGPFFSPGSVVAIEIGNGQSSALASGYFPSWSPDGAWIAYLSVPVADTAARESVSSPGSVLRLVRQSGAEDHDVFVSASGTPGGGRVWNGWAWAPIVWSPDASRLAFSRLENNGSAVWELSLGGGEAQRRSVTVTDSATRSGRPRT
jgi:hypothetical protein